MAVASPEVKVVVAADPTPSSPRISFSTDFSGDEDGDGEFICINPVVGKEEKDKGQAKVADFEFLSENANSGQAMLTADELFFEGKLLPFWQMQKSEKLKGVRVNSREGEEGRAGEEEDQASKDEENRGSWFLDEDPSPRPPKCTVLWKELLRLKKQKGRASSLSPSSSSSSTSSCSSSLGEAARKEEREKEGKRGRKGLVRTRSSSLRIRPMINVPICSHPKSLPPLFPLSLKKGRVERHT